MIKGISKQLDIGKKHGKRHALQAAEEAIENIKPMRHNQ